MSFKDLQKLKKQANVQAEKIYSRFIFVGTDLFTIGLYLDAKQRFGEQEVKLLLPDQTSWEGNFWGPEMLRGEANVQALKQAYPDLEFTSWPTPPLFYKELQWREFGGRAKPEALKFGEEYYTEPAYSIDWNKVFPWLADNASTFDQLKKSAWSYQIKQVNAAESQDLIERSNFVLSCSNGQELFCEYLVWGLNPHRFMDLFGKKELLSNRFIELCESTQTPSSLYIHCTFERPLSDLKETLFMPLSYTHEWGHFIGEFRPTDMAGGSQQLGRFAHFVDLHHTDEEEISKKIRSLKKNLEKIFPEVKKINYQEKIVFTDETPCLKIDDRGFNDEMQKWPFLLFASFNAPFDHDMISKYSFEDSEKNISHTSRALLRQHFLVQFLQTL